MSGRVGVVVALLGASALFAVAGCGGDDDDGDGGGLDRSDPEAVLEAWLRADFECTDEALTLQYDLTADGSDVAWGIRKPAEGGAEGFVQQVQSSGECQPTDVPELRVSVASESDEKAGVSVEYVSGSREPEQYVLVQEDGEWGVDEELIE